MPVFPTFRLPLLAAKAVANRMDIGALTALFLCSKKTREFVKALRKPLSFLALSIESKKNLNCLEIIELFHEDKLTAKFLARNTRGVNIKVSDDIGFKLSVQFDIHASCLQYSDFHIYANCKNQQDHYKGAKRNLEIDGIDVPVVMTKKNELHIFWDNKQEGFKKMGDYLVESNFHLGFEGLFIKGGMSDDFHENLRFIINWISSTNKSLKYCTVKNYNRSINDEILKFIINNVRASFMYDINVELSDQFQHPTHFNSSWLKLKPANWFTLENLLMTQCTNIHLSESKLTNADLKEYLQKWMAGKFNKLENLHVEMQEDIDINIILSGLEVSPVYKYGRKEDSVRITNDKQCIAEISTSGSTPRTFKMKIS